MIFLLVARVAKWQRKAKHIQSLKFKRRRLVVCESVVSDADASDTESAPLLTVSQAPHDQ